MWHKPQLMNWVSNLLIGTSVLILLYAAIFVVIHLPVFPIQRVVLDRPLHHVTQAQVQFVVQNEMRGNFFTVDLNHMRDAFEKLPWVDHVILRRRWPNILDISLEEHEALARWGDAALLNVRGERFSAASNDDLPVFRGDDGMEMEMVDGYHEFSKLLQPTGHHIQELLLTSRHAWTLKLDTGLVIQLGRENVDERLGHFVEVYDRTVAALPNLDYMDLRYPNGFAVRMKLNELPAGMKLAKKAKHPAKKDATHKPPAVPAKKTPRAKPKAVPVVKPITGTTGPAAGDGSQ